MTAPYDQARHSVRLEWGPTGGQAVATGATFAVVVDVLSFTTTLSVAADLGIEVLPYRWQDDGAAAYARDHDAVLALGRREAAALGEGAASLSPGSLRSAAGLRRLVLPSPNGSAISFLLADGGATVVGASLRNAGAVASWLAERLREEPGGTVAVVAAGERWPDGSLRPAVEDLLGAGAVVAGLDQEGVSGASPEAALAAAAYRTSQPRLRETLLACTSGQELVGRGFASDVEVAAERDVSAGVPVLDGGCFRPRTGSNPRPTG